jgi:15-cis-phytoene synthase
VMAAATARLDGERLARAILRRRARSFAWAARLLPAGVRRDATVLYAWCRRCDDAVDEAPGAAAAVRALARLRVELDQVYGPYDVSDPVLASFQELVRRTELPRRPADELLDGMEMDLGVVRYRAVSELIVYCHRVAGTVGVMMAHVMGVRAPAALRRADHLGIAMQLTNICRDVVEDEARDRVYLPVELLAVATRPSAVPERAAGAVAALLRLADAYYRSGDRGLSALPARCALGIRAARLIYAEIGAVLARRGFAIAAARAIVSPARKLWLVVRACVATAAAALGPRAA